VSDPPVQDVVVELGSELGALAGSTDGGDEFDVALDLMSRVAVSHIVAISQRHKSHQERGGEPV